MIEGESDNVTREIEEAIDLFDSAKEAFLRRGIGHHNSHSFALIAIATRLNGGDLEGVMDRYEKCEEEFKARHRALQNADTPTLITIISLLNPNSQVGEK